MLRQVGRVRILGIVLVTLAAAACRQGATGSRAHRPGTDGAATGTPAPGTATAGTTEPPPPCGGVGTPWNGRAEGCAYEHESCCYADAETACKVAACAPEHCTVLETYPAQIRCDAPEAPPS